MAFELKTTHSKDGTKIGYYEVGSGPGIIILHGAFQHALSHTDIATILSKDFTCYLPDRRGRGQSGPTGKNFSIQKEVEDVEAIHLATGAKFIFGVSSGALITLKAALAAPPSHVAKIALFEPPWWGEADREVQMTWIKRYKTEADQGQFAEAASTAMLGAQMGPTFFQSQYFPRAILIFLTKLMIRYDKPVGLSLEQTASNVPSQPTPLFKDLIPTFRNDVVVATEMLGEEQLGMLSAIRAKTLILGGSKSPPYLQHAVRELERIVPGSRRVELQNMDHGGTNNKAQHGSPELFAEELKRFFSEGNGTERL